MTSASLSNLPHNILLVAATLMIALPSAALAQYAPPPMFDDMESNMARPNAPSGYIVEPKASPSKPEMAPPAPGTQRPAIVAPRVSVDPDKNPVAPATPYVPRMAPIVETKPGRKVSRTPAPAVIPSKKPAAPAVAIPPPQTVQETAPIYEPEPVYSPVVKPDPAPSPTPTPAPRTPKANGHMPAAKVTSPGFVTGPKTMPAVPTTNVDQVKTFEGGSAQGEPTILERHLKETRKKEAKSETLTPVIPPAKPAEVKVVAPTQAIASEASLIPSAVTPATFENAKPEVMKKILPFQSGQIDLAAGDLDAIAAGIQGELKTKPDWRIQIRSFATPQGDGLASDRRIALSRGLSIRTALVARGIDASVIDLRADGLQTDGSQTGDRVDLYLYNPAEPVQTP